jgi:hypothetical protein
MVAQGLKKQIAALIGELRKAVAGSVTTGWRRIVPIHCCVYHRATFVIVCMRTPAC